MEAVVYCSPHRQWLVGVCIDGTQVLLSVKDAGPCYDPPKLTINGLRIVEVVSGAGDLAQVLPPSPKGYVLSAQFAHLLDEPVHLVILIEEVVVGALE